MAALDSGTVAQALQQHTRQVLEDNWEVHAAATSGATAVTVQLQSAAAVIPNPDAGRIALLTGATMTFWTGLNVGFSTIVSSVTNSGGTVTVTFATALPAAAAKGDQFILYADGAGTNSSGYRKVDVAASDIQMPADLQGIDQPSADSTTATLAANGVYTGTAFDTTNARGIIGIIFSDQSGTLQVQQSPDGTNWDVVDTIYYPGGSLGLEFRVPVVAPGKSQGRLVYTDGPTTQTDFRLYANTTPQPVERSTSVATVTATTTSITTGGTSQALFGARQGRRLLLIQNPSTAALQGITTAESLFFDFGAAAVAGPPAIELPPGGTYIADGNVDPQAIHAIAATSGHAFSAKQG